MEKSVTERFKHIIEIKAPSATAFSSEIGISQSTLSSQFSSKTGIQLSVITATLKRFSDISAEWLLRGKGEMILSDNLPPIVGDESENDLDTHAMLAQARKEIDVLVQEVATLKEKIIKQAGAIEWQKDFISELIDEKKELERKLPQETKKDIV